MLSTRYADIRHATPATPCYETHTLIAAVYVDMRTHAARYHVYAALFYATFYAA